MSINNMVVGFITDFKLRNGPVLVDTFSGGYCYYFAVMLQERFKEYGGEIYYNQVDNHFAYFLDWNLYDITGRIPDEDKGKFVPWKLYKLAEPLDAGRVDRDCIKKYNADTPAKPSASLLKVFKSVEPQTQIVTNPEVLRTVNSEISDIPFK